MAQERPGSLTGHLRDITGRGIPHVVVELQAENPRGRDFKTEADESGSYAFVKLPADEYTLRLQQSGFISLTVKAIQVGEGEEKAVPLLELQIGAVADCGGHAVVDYLRILDSSGNRGSIRGSVRLDQGSKAPFGRPIQDAEIALICVDSACRSTKTNSTGEFMFRDVPSGRYAINVSAKGFYPFLMPGFLVQSAMESVYYPLVIEACPRGDCSPTRPKKPIAICE